MTDLVRKESEPKLTRALRGIMLDKGAIISEIRITQKGHSGSSQIGKLDREAVKQKPEDLEREIIDLCVSDADHQQGMVTYEILFLDESSEVLRRHFFRLQGKAEFGESFDDDLEGGGSSSGVIRGHFAQALAHNERLTRTYLTAINGVMSLQQNTINKLTQEKQDLLSTYVEVLKLVQDLLDRKAERDLKNKREERNDRLVEQGLQQVLTFLPILIAKLSKGKFALPEGAMTPKMAAAENELKKLIHSLKNDPARVTRMVQDGMIKQEEVQSLMLLAEIFEEKEKEVTAVPTSGAG